MDVREQEERRHHRRANHAIIRLSVGGRTYPAANWSLGGALLEGTGDHLAAGALVAITAIGAVEDTLAPVRVRARVQRVGRERGDAALAFLDLDGPAYRVMQELMEARSRREKNRLREDIMKIKVEKPSPETIAAMRREPVWTKETSTFPWEYDMEETCYLLEGEVRVTTLEGAAVSFGAGDLVTFPKGLKCTWDIRKPVRKHYRFG